MNGSTNTSSSSPLPPPSPSRPSPHQHTNPPIITSPPRPRLPRPCYRNTSYSSSSCSSSTPHHPARIPLHHQHKPTSSSLRSLSLPNLSSCAMNSAETMLLARTGDLLVCQCRYSLPQPPQPPPPPITTTPIQTIAKPLPPPPPSPPSPPKEEKRRSRRSHNSETSPSRSLVIRPKDDVTISDCCGLTDTQAVKCAEAVRDQVLHMGGLGGRTNGRYGLMGGAETPPALSPTATESVINAASEAKVEDEWEEYGGLGINPGSFECDNPSPTNSLGMTPLLSFDNASVVHSVASGVHSVASGMSAMTKESGLTEGVRFMKTKAVASASTTPIPISPPKTATPFLHGVPHFLSSLTQVRITKISANPLGSHALLVSSDGMLFSYGNNEQGQLGLGSKSCLFIQSPTLITPLLENGGKSIDCAAGATHSLVVVKTDGTRVGRLTKGGTTCYHQLYAFGQNDYMKLGLVNPTRSRRGEEQDALSPRRVAMHAKLSPDGDDEHGDGIIQIGAGLYHSVALVKRCTPDKNRFEVYAWGKGGDGATAAKDKIIPLPRLVENLNLSEKEHPVKIAVGPRCTIVLTSKGGLYGFGTSEDGVLGMGQGVTETDKPRPIPINTPDTTASPDVQVQSVQVGASHAVCVTTEGRVYTWGSSRNGRLAFGATKGTVWEPRLLSLSLFENSQSRRQREVPKHKLHEGLLVHQAWAGLDTTVFLMRNGALLSCGRGSGRLGQGEIMRDVMEPQNMFGGLRLWDERMNNEGDDEID